MKVPFVELKSQYMGLKGELEPVVKEVLESGYYVGGPNVEGFEKEFASYCGSRFAVGVANGTDALRFGLMASGIGKGHEVITVPNTFIATAEAIYQVGAKTVFVDINDKTYNIDVQKIEKAITKRTRAILPVHLYGQPADMDEIMELAKKYNLIVIEDACQAHGSAYKGKKVGTFGKVGCFSFYPSKNLGAFGEGGAITTNDEALAALVKMIRDHGQSKKYFHEVEGFNGRLDALQAAVLRVKLRHLDEWSDARREHARLYNELLKGVEQVVTPYEPPYMKAVYHLYIIRAQRRNALMEFLNKGEIGTALHYPVPIHMQKAYSGFGYKAGDFPVTEQNVNEILSLPMYPELKEEQIRFICGKIREFYKK